jgi:hypothetical protein
MALWHNKGRTEYLPEPTTTYTGIYLCGSAPTFPSLTCLIPLSRLKQVERSTSFSSSTCRLSIHHNSAAKEKSGPFLISSVTSALPPHPFFIRSVGLLKTMRTSYCYSSLWALMLLHIRRNSFVLRAYAFASSTAASTTAHDLSSSSSLSTAFFRNPTSSRRFSSLSERIVSSSSVGTYNKYHAITATTSSTVKSLGGMCYTEIPEHLQRVVFVLGGPGSGKVRPSSLLVLCFFTCDS